MFTRRLITVLIFVLALVPLAKAQDAASTAPTGSRPAEIAINESTTLQIVGFGDLLATFQDENDGSTFNIGQAEVDLESELTDHFAIALAIAYDEGTFTIGAFTADYTAWSAADDKTSSSLGFRNLSVGGGQYDVMFGIDWHVYPSINRKLVSSPLVVENTHNSWNDLGVYVTAEAIWGNITAFTANGFCHEGLDPEGKEMETHNDLAVGGRLGITPLENIEVGGSIASITGLDYSHNMILAGVDLQMSLIGLEIKGEYIIHEFDSGVISDFTNDGYYVQGLYGIGNWYLVGRYGEFRPDQQSANIARISAGIGRSINEVAELRFEYQANKAADDAAIFQVAFGF